MQVGLFPSSGSRFGVSTLRTEPWPGQPSIVVVRGDLIHPIISGNKLFKLIPHLKKAKELKKATLISVGGRYSNHLHAMAWAGQQQGFRTLGIVRSYKDQPTTPTLFDCQHWGMQIKLLEPNRYAARYEEAFWQHLERDYPNSYAIKEGGWSEESIVGSASWWPSIPDATDVVIVPVGSGTTLAGLIKSAPHGTKVIGVPVYRDPNDYKSLRDSLHDLGIEQESYELWTGHAGKGFGRTSPQLDQFSESFTSLTGILLDPVYNSKTFNALHERLLRGQISDDINIAILHTGGLQGMRR